MQMRSDEPQVTAISEEEWSRLPSRMNPPSHWDRVLDQLADGHALRITLSDPARVRGAKTALGKRAKRRGLELEFKTIMDGVNELAVRAVTTHLPEEHKATRGRPRKEKVVQE